MISARICRLFPIFVSILGIIASASAAIITPVDASAWDRGSGSANGTGTGGLLQTTTLELGLSKPDTNDPATWTTGRNWNYDFQGQDVNSLTSKPWIIYDFGTSVTALDQLYIWNVSEATGWGRGIKEFNIYYSNSPNATIPVSASSSNLSDGASNVKNYDFSSGGWTKLNISALTLDRGAENEGGTDINPYDGVFDLSAIASARYIGIEALSSYNETTGNPFGTATGTNARVGINRIAFTTVPEPRAALLGGIGLLMLLRRRR